MVVENGVEKPDEIQSNTGMKTERKRSGVDRGVKLEQAQDAASIAAFLGRDFTQLRSEVRPPLPILPSAFLTP